MLYAACPEKLFSFWGGGLGPLFLNFLDLPLKFSYHTIYLKNVTAALGKEAGSLCRIRRYHEA